VECALDNQEENCVSKASFVAGETDAHSTLCVSCVVRFGLGFSNDILLTRRGEGLRELYVKIQVVPRSKHFIDYEMQLVSAVQDTALWRGTLLYASKSHFWNLFLE
jgi:hypothetical protein